ncbi:prepilin peptidase [Spirochaetota bacterium]
MTVSNYIFLFFIGALWGSFFYTLALRYADGSLKENVLKALFSSSKCPLCKERINPLYLVPFLGFIIQKGKCKKCGGRISILYPAFEILFGIILLLIIIEYGLSLYSINIFFLVCVALTISIIDIKTLIIPGSLVITFGILSIYPVIYNFTFLNNLYGFLLMFLFFIIILLIFPGAFGGGDVKFASVIGLLFGLEYSIVVLETALISGALVGTIYALKTKKSFRTKIPFGPFLAFGIIIAFLYGREIILIYSRLTH